MELLDSVLTCYLDLEPDLLNLYYSSFSTFLMISLNLSTSFCAWVCWGNLGVGSIIRYFLSSYDWNSYSSIELNGSMSCNGVLIEEAKDWSWLSYSLFLLLSENDISRIWFSDLSSYFLESSQYSWKEGIPLETFKRSYSNDFYDGFWKSDLSSRSRVLKL